MFLKFRNLSANSSIPLFSEATVRTTGGCQPSRDITSDSMPSIVAPNGPAFAIRFVQNKNVPNLHHPAFMF